MRVCIIGTGLCRSHHGHLSRVFGSRGMLRRYRRGQGGTASRRQDADLRPFLEELLKEAGSNIRFTTEYAEGVPGAGVVFIAVGTPPGNGGSPDLRYLRAAAEEIGRWQKGDFTVVVNKSTVPIGSGNWVDSLLRESFEKHHGCKPERVFAVASNPEFLREGSAISDTLYPDRVVIGADDSRSLETLYTLYRPLLDQTFTPPAYLPRPDGLGAVPLVSTDLASAELIKYAANAFLALKISYINEIGGLADRVGADIVQVAKGIGLDQRIGNRFLHAGIGWGGSCFGKDTAALVATAAEYQLKMPIVSAAREVNQHQRELVIEKLLSELRILKGRTIGLLGLAFKPNTDDLREAPAVDIARMLLARGCKVRVHDPVALDRFRLEHADLEVVCCDSADEVADSADAVVLVTEWPEYQELDWAALVTRMRLPIVLDGRNALDRERLRRFGIRYLALSSPAAQQILTASN